MKPWRGVCPGLGEEREKLGGKFFEWVDIFEAPE